MKFLKNNEMLDITEANPEEAEEILEYLKIVGGETDYLLIDEKGLGITVEEEKKIIESYVNDPGKNLIVGRIKDEIVSVGDIKCGTREKVKHNSSIGLSVKKDHWNQGVGGYMMEFLINFARIDKFTKNIILEVRADNEFAIKLYKKQGFKEVGKIKDKFFVNEKFYDELIMLLQIK